MQRIVILTIFAFQFLASTAMAADVQLMKPERLHSLLREGSGVWIVDVRGGSAYEEGHIEGSIHIPAGIIGTRRVPSQKGVVLVDDVLGERNAREAADSLRKRGVEKVSLLEGGLAAWEAEGYAVAGAGRQRFRSVMPDEIAWAQDKKIPLRIFDLRDKTEQAQAPVAQAQGVEGESLQERLEKVAETIQSEKKKGLSAKLEKPSTVVVVFPTAVEPRPLLDHSLGRLSGDIRFLEGGYAAWAARPDKELKTVGVCPTCPGGTSGGNR